MSRVHLNGIQENISLTNGWDSGHNFAEFKLVKDGCFTSSIETDHKDS